MPTYITRTVTDVNFGFSCPFCANKYKSKSGLITHAKHCKENPEPGETFDDIVVWEGASATDMITWQEEVIKLTKELIVSNEMTLIQSQEPEQIRDNIRQRLIVRMQNNYVEESDIYRIYEFFFGLTDADVNNRIKEACGRMRKIFFPQDDETPA